MSQDPLTGLPDRQQFLADLEQTLSGELGEPGLVALILIKVKRLRDFNIELGYREGDDLITQIAQKIRDCLRQGDKMARVGTGEFALILPALRTQGQPLMAVSKIQRTFEEPLEIQGRELKVRMSFGVSLAPRDGETPEKLQRSADLALRHAINEGRATVLYQECGELETLPTLELENELEGAIRNAELATSYQPIIDVETGELTGVELLSRWTSPVHGPVRPEQFLDIAERGNLIMPFTLWSLNNGLRECSEWQSALPNTAISINLSSSVLLESHLPELVLRSLKVWDTRVGHLTIEITEDAMMSDPQACLQILNQLHEYGVKIAIDDFGTGYSSLAYLKDLPVSELKIDQSFVTKMIDNIPDRRIVQSVIDLAHNFDVTVVAEGVEDEETLDTLTLMGCQRAQGDFIGRAVALDELAEWLQTSDWELRAEAETDTGSYLDMSSNVNDPSAVQTD